jgi:hypothetical protein
MSLKNPVTPSGIDPGTVRLVAQRLNHYATPGPPKVIRSKQNRTSPTESGERDSQVGRIVSLFLSFTCKFIISVYIQTLGR